MLIERNSQRTAENADGFHRKKLCKKSGDLLCDFIQKLALQLQIQTIQTNLSIRKRPLK